MIFFFLEKWSNLHERCWMCWNKWKINFSIFPIFIFSYGWLYLWFTGGTPGFSSVSPTKKKTFKSGQIYSKDAQWAETDFPFFTIFSFWHMVVSVLRIGQFSVNFEYKIDHISKNKNRKNQKIYFSLHTALCVSFTQIWPLLRGGNGVCISLDEKHPTF